MFPELLIFILLLIGLWWIYKIWRSSLHSWSDDPSYSRNGVSSGQSGDERDRQSIFHKVPQIFTQPHLGVSSGQSAGRPSTGSSTSQGQAAGSAGSDSQTRYTGNATDSGNAADSGNQASGQSTTARAQSQSAAAQSVAAQSASVRSTPSNSGSTQSASAVSSGVDSRQANVGGNLGGEGKNTAELQRQLDDTKAQLERMKTESEAVQSKAAQTNAQEKSAELERQAEYNQQLQMRLSELEIERKTNEALKLENDDLRRSAEQTRILESKIEQLEGQGNPGGAAGTTNSSMSVADLDELKRLRAELDGQKQQNEKYLLQISDLKSQVRDDKTVQTNSGAASAGSTTATSKPARKPLFERPAEQDDLKKVKGIGPVMEKTLNDLGVTSFKQLADFTSDDIQMVSDALDVFPGRIERDEWVPQAGELYRKKYLAKG